MKNKKRKLSPELQAIVEWEKENEVSSLSAIMLIDDGGDEVSPEPYFGRCDISGEWGTVWDVEFIDTKDKMHEATISHKALCYFYNGID